MPQTLATAIICDDSRMTEPTRRYESTYSARTFRKIAHIVKSRKFIDLIG